MWSLVPQVSRAQDFSTRVSHKSVLQECPTRVPRESVRQECPSELATSSTSVMQEAASRSCSTNVAWEAASSAGPQNWPLGITNVVGAAAGLRTGQNWQLCSTHVVRMGSSFWILVRNSVPNTTTYRPHMSPSPLASLASPCLARFAQLLRAVGKVAGVTS